MQQCAAASTGSRKQKSDCVTTPLVTVGARFLLNVYSKHSGQDVGIRPKDSQNRTKKRGECINSAEIRQAFIPGVGDRSHVRP